MIYVFFEHGIILSYDRIYHSSMNYVELFVYSSRNRTIKYYHPLRKGIFIVFVDDNLGKNSSSIDTKNNFQGTDMMVLQFLTFETPGE